MNILFVGNFNVSYSSENHHKASLESLGHEVSTLQEGQATYKNIIDNLQGKDILIWVHTHGWTTENLMQVFNYCDQHNIPTLTYHLDLWFGLDRQSDLDDDPFYKRIGYFFTVDKLMSDWFNKNTDVKGYYLPAGVYDKECYIHPSKSDEYDYEVAFVGSRGYHPEYPYRPKLIDWLKDTYGSRFTHVGGDGELGTTRGDDLNRFYANTKIVIGDSLNLNFDYPYYWSDRIYETTGRGGFIIHPFIKGLEKEFKDGKHVIFYEYNDFKQLKNLIDYYLYDNKSREKIREAGHEHTKANHTYKERWKTIIEVVDETNKD